jgi:polar amino acid transport system substrate-binding protein
LAALKGKRIAIVEGYSYGDTIDKAGPTFVRTPSEEESVAQLLNSAVDYTLMDELVVRYITSTYPKEAQSRLQFGSTSLITRPLHLALRNDLPGAQSIVDRFNAQLRAMITDRTYHRLLHVDWINADVDGDGIPELVPRGDRVGIAPPQAAYSITTTTEKAGTKQPSGKESRFYVGGNLYTDWASVPNSYKVEDPKRPDPSRSAASIFTFRW